MPCLGSSFCVHTHPVQVIKYYLTILSGLMWFCITWKVLVRIDNLACPRRDIYLFRKWYNDHLVCLQFSTDFNIYMIKI